MSSDRKHLEAEKPRRSDSLSTTSPSSVKAEFPDQKIQVEQSKQIHEIAVSAFYDRVWNLICTISTISWNYFTRPVGKPAWSVIHAFLYPIYMFPYEMVRYPIHNIGRAILKDVAALEPTGPFKDYVMWYRSHRTKTFAGISIFATVVSLALSFILAQTLLLTDIDFTIDNLAFSKVKFD